MSSPPYILGIESSCDETACALVDRQGAVKVNAVASQVDLHARFGGVVPEVAARRHIETCLPLITEALRESQTDWSEISAIAVTQGPGLIGCLLIGVETAKALAWRHDKPLIAVHHLQAHLHAPFLRPEKPEQTHLLIEDGKDFSAIPFDDGEREFAGGAPAPRRIARPEFPHVGLIVSGGHTSLVWVESPGKCATLASTRDDAVGEAYDKVARILGIGFPGGPAVDQRAPLGNPNHFLFKTPMSHPDADGFSFSGLKSAVARRVEELKSGIPNPQSLPEGTIRDLCAGFQAAAIEALLSKSLTAAEERDTNDLLIVGGVASNRGLRRSARKIGPRGLRVWFPHFSLCTDNAAMIAGLAWHIKPLSGDEALNLNPSASLPLD